MHPSGSDRRANPSPFIRVGIYLPMLVVAGVSASVLVYLFVMSLLGWQLPGSADSGGSASLSARVYLYAPQTSANYFNKIGGNYETLVQPWRLYFKDRQRKFTEIKTGADLRGLSPGVMVIPSALSISDEDREQLKIFRDNGGAILATWATGTRNEKGDWAGWGLVEEWSGGKLLGESLVAESAPELLLYGNAPVAHTLPAGHSIFMSPVQERVLRIQAPGIAAHFADLALSVDAQGLQEGALLYHEVSAALGRSAVMAFAETTWESHPLAMYAVIDDTLKWLAREAVVTLSPWPNAKRAAHLTHMVVRRDLGVAGDYIESVRASGVRPSLYLASGIAAEHTQSLRAMAAQADISYTLSIPDITTGTSVRVIEAKLLASKAELAAALPDVAKPTGLGVPQLSRMNNLEDALVRTAVDHQVLQADRELGSIPKQARKGEDLLLLPRRQRSVDEWLQHKGAQGVGPGLVSDAEINLRMGGIGMLSLQDTDDWTPAQMKQALADYYGHLQKNRVHFWVATSEKMTQWWRERSRVRMTQSNPGRRVEFNLTVTGDAPIQGLTLVVMLAEKGAPAVVRAQKVGLPSPLVAKLDEYRASLFFETLQPGNYSYVVTFAQ